MNIGVAKLKLNAVFAPRAIFAKSAVNDYRRANVWPTLTIPLGKKILKRRFDFAGCSVEMPGRIAWKVDSASPEWHREFYSFWWLSEISAGKHNREAASFAREFVSSFIVEQRDVPGIAWERDVAGARLYHWLDHFEFLMKGSSKAFRHRFAKSIIRHVLFLNRRLPGDVSAELLAGLFAAARRFADCEFLMPALTRALEMMLDEDFYPDGSHRSASPLVHYQKLRTLINIRNLLLPQNLMYADLTLALQKIGAMLHFFSHGDGRLALFNGSIMEDAAMLTKTAELSGAGDTFPIQSEAGFVHLCRKKTSVILQVSEQGRMDYKGLLSFEMSDGSNRIVVNCGAYLGTDDNWKIAVRTPSAHSTLSLEPLAAPLPEAEAKDGEEDGRENRATVGTEDVLTGEQFHHVFVSAISPQYVDTHGLRFKRYIKISSKGDKVNGGDSILRERGDSKVAGQLRFHLHPDVRCQKLSENKVQLSTLGGATWYFEVHSPQKVTVEESIYLGHNGRPQKTLQIIILVEITEPQTEVLWSLARKAAEI